MRLPPARAIRTTLTLVCLVWPTAPLSRAATPDGDREVAGADLGLSPALAPDRLATTPSGEVAFAIDGGEFLVRSRGRVWKWPGPADGRASCPKCLAVSGNETVVVGDDMGGVTVFRAAAGPPKPILCCRLPNPDVVTACSPSPDGSSLLAVSHRGVYVFDAASGKQLAYIAEARPDVRALWLGRERLLVWGGWGFQVRSRLGGVLADVPMPGVTRVAVSAGGGTVAVARGAEPILLWESAAQKGVGTIKPANPVVSLEFVPGTHLLLTSGERRTSDAKEELVGGVVEMWNCNSCKIIERLKAHPPPLTDRELFPKILDGGAGIVVPKHGHFFATTGADGRTRLWETRSGRLIVSVKNLRLTQWCDDGHHFVAAKGDRTVMGSLRDLLPGTASDRSTWESLGRSAPEAFAAAERASADPQKTIDHLSASLAAAPPPSVAWVEARVGALDSVEFADRERATEELKRYPATFAVYFRKRAAGADTPELARRLNEVISAGRFGLSQDELRVCRAIYLLERVGNEEARKALKCLRAAYQADSQIAAMIDRALAQPEQPPRRP